MIIAQISDTHIALDTPDADQRMRDFASTVTDINALDPAPDVIVHTGDIVHNGRADEYGKAVATLAKARVPVYVMVGNKDDRANLVLPQFCSVSLNGISAIKENEYGTQTQRRIPA
jgi:3',5'-cyclic AMP phosphodiesterase CpdA